MPGKIFKNAYSRQGYVKKHDFWANLKEKV